jgi:hypothetical protein
MPQAQPQAQPDQNAFNMYLSTDDPMSLDPGHTDHRQAEYRYYTRAGVEPWAQAQMPAQIKTGNVNDFIFTVCDNTDELPNSAPINLDFDHSPFTDAVTTALANGSKFQYKGRMVVEGAPPGHHQTWQATMHRADFDADKIGSGLSVEFTMTVNSTTKYYLDPKMIVRT